MKTKLVLILLLSLFLSTKSDATLFYAKVGGANPAGNASGIYPLVGVGARFQNDTQGIDISLSASSLILMNQLCLKGAYLFYPNPGNKQFYFGMGGGFGYGFGAIPTGQPKRVASHEQRIVTAEGVLGYEFRHAAYFKTFVQLELSQPVVNFTQNKAKRSYKPGVAITTGFGF